MNRFLPTLLLTALTVFFTAQNWAASGHSPGHGAHVMEDSGTMKPGHDGHGSGTKIHASAHDGYTFEYRLIDMKERMKHVKNMPEMKDTHHLMVFVKDSHGLAVKTAKVGYLIQEKGSKAMQKKMAMAMNNGFGADVTLIPGTHYRIKTKVMAGSGAVMDEFEYMGSGR